MVERFVLKGHVGFESAVLELSKGLIVFTGPSGSGKSVLMNALLGSFGLSDASPKLCESSLSIVFDETKEGLVNESPNVFKLLKGEKKRFYVNEQSISQKRLSMLSKQFVTYVNHKDTSFLQSDALLELLDAYVSTKKPSHARQLQSHAGLFSEYSQKLKSYRQLCTEEKNVNELKEFARFEIEKIEGIAPREGEDASLADIKKLLSRKDKVMESIENCEQLFMYEGTVRTLCELLGKESAFFDDAMYELRSMMEGANEQFEELESTDIEAVLDRIEQLSELKRRYGSIDEALEYKEQKKQELAHYENISFEKEGLEKALSLLEKELDKSAAVLHEARNTHIKQYEDAINTYLEQLYINTLSISLERCESTQSGTDVVALKLLHTTLDKISSGETNRLKLAMLALKQELKLNEGGILILDEIDANLSGEESMSVAKLLKKLSCHYQIFAISHQSQLTSLADLHYVVKKENMRSSVTLLEHEGRINEIARIISGEKVSDKALRFAKELLEGEKDAY